MAAARSICVRSSWRRRIQPPATLPPVITTPKLAQSLLVPPAGAPRLSEWAPVLSSVADFRGLRRSQAKSRCCIALLCRGASIDQLTSFVEYHFFIGFEAIYMYLDDPAELPALASLAQSEPRLHVVACDATFWRGRLASSAMLAHREQQRVFDDVARTVQSEVQSRQSLCVEHAIERTVSRGFDWLLHIDVDECFLPQEKQPVDFFSLLPAEVEQVFFANLEAVPSPSPASASLDVCDWLKSVTQFKVSPAHVQPWEALEAVWRRIEAARQAAQPASVPTSYFTAYASGKSAVRLPHPLRMPADEEEDSSADGAAAAAAAEHAAPSSPSSLLPVPFDVHKFLVPNGLGGWRMPRTLTCTDSLAHEDAPVVLHFPSCGFNNWLRKYELLGAFGDQWWGRVPCRIPAHLQSRDVVQRHLAEGRTADSATGSGLGGGFAACEEFYRWRVVGNELGEHALLRAHGLLVDVEFPRSVVRAAAKKRAASTPENESYQLDVSRRAHGASPSTSASVRRPAASASR